MSKGLKTTLITLSVANIVLGLCQVIWPMGSQLVICYVLGTALVLFGLYMAFRYFWGSTTPIFGTMGLALGSAAAIFGLLIIIGAKNIVAIFGVIMGIIILVNSILRLQLSFNMLRAQSTNYLVVLIFSIIMLIFGFFVLFNPIKAANIAATVVGICLLVDGLMNLLSVVFAAKGAEY